MPHTSTPNQHLQLSAGLLPSCIYSLIHSLTHSFTHSLKMHFFTTHSFTTHSFTPHTLMHLLNYLFSCLIHSCIHSFTHSLLAHLFIPSLSLSFTCSFTHSFTSSLTHLTHSFLKYISSVLRISDKEALMAWWDKPRHCLIFQGGRGSRFQKKTTSPHYREGTMTGGGEQSSFCAEWAAGAKAENVIL